MIILADMNIDIFTISQQSADCLYKLGFPKTEGILPLIYDVIEWLRVKYRLWVRISNWNTSTKSWKEDYEPDEFDFSWECLHYNQDNEVTPVDCFELVCSDTLSYTSFNDGYLLALKTALEHTIEYINTNNIKEYVAAGSDNDRK